MVTGNTDSAGASIFGGKRQHPFTRSPLDTNALKARLAYDLMAFMRREDCPYFLKPSDFSKYNPFEKGDEIDIMIVDGHYSEAQNAIQHKLAIDPDCDKALFQRAFLKYLEAEYERILYQEEQILARDPKNVNAMLNKGFALMHLGRGQEALKITDQALALEPDNLRALEKKARIARAMGKDSVRDMAVMQAYNIAAERRMALLEERESRLLRDFGALIVTREYDEAIKLEKPLELDLSQRFSPSPASAFQEFNRRSAYESALLH